jgi:glycyl-tRNA synthetase (class II)
MATINRTALEELMKKRFFYTPSFQVYGGKVIFTFINSLTSL